LGESHENKYGANERAQMLKYHIQTSGRSLHAQEIDFNDMICRRCMRFMTTVIRLPMRMTNYALQKESCNGDSIINKELGLAKNENPIQGAFIIEELTDLVESRLLEF
jgi:methylmalonyl-CoA mutase